MVTTDELLDFSDAEGFLHLPAETAGGIDALAVQLPSGCCAWAVERKGLSEAQYRQKASHEIGHCASGAFYTRYAAPAARYRAEALADRWSYRRMIPLSGLLDAISERETELWQLAERFGAPEGMVREALEYYAAAFGPILRTARKRNDPSPGKGTGRRLEKT